MVTLVVALVIVALLLALVVAIALDPGPSADDVASAYELAWDRLDFDAVWSLSASELRDGRDRKAFIADKRAAYAGSSELAGLADRVNLEDVAVAGEAAVVHTKVDLHDGTAVRNRLDLVRRDGKWQVLAYSLADADHDRHA